jgi:hypothetical protein
LETRRSAFLALVVSAVAEAPQSPVGALKIKGHFYKYSRNTILQIIDKIVLSAPMRPKNRTIPAKQPRVLPAPPDK